MAAKAAKNSIPLWVLFIAVQLLDVAWSFFVLLGNEKVRIGPGITATNPLDLYYMPYTHKLIFFASFIVLLNVLRERNGALKTSNASAESPRQNSLDSVHRR